jgi:beta-lactam-binding protein with PASTA domain
VRDATRAGRAGRFASGVALLAWLLAALVLGLAGWVLARHLAVEETRTPALVGLPLSEAGRVAERAGLELRSYPVEGRDLGTDVVVEQSPPAGSIVRVGRRVDIGVHVPSEADRMPALVGLHEEDAVATLRNLGLPAPALSYEATSTPAGRVVRQEPDPERSLPPGTTVTLVVSRGEGPGRIELPDLRGLDIEAARAQAAALGLRRVEALPVAVRAERPGVVTLQRPGPGAIVPPGEPLALGYAVDGADIVDVPDVAGLPAWRARVELRRAGLAIGPLETVRRDDLPEGVVESRPAGLTVAGAPVTLVVNTLGDAPPSVLPGDLVDGPTLRGAGGDVGPDRTSPGGAGDADVPSVVGGDPAGGRLIPFTFDPSALGVRALNERDYELRLVVRDDLGERTVLDRRVAAGAALRTSIVVHGDEPLLQTFVNGVFFQAWRP